MCRIAGYTYVKNACYERFDLQTVGWYIEDERYFYHRCKTMRARFLEINYSHFANLSCEKHIR